MSFYIVHGQGWPSGSHGFNAQLVQLVGKFWVFLSHTAPWVSTVFFFFFFFFLTSACGSSTGVCSWGYPGGLGLPRWGPAVEVLQLLGSQGFWQHQVLRGVGGQSSRKFSALEGCGNQYWPGHSSILAWRTPDRQAWQDTVYRGTKSWTGPKWPCVHGHFFWPVAALPQWELSVKGAQLLGLQGPWWCQVWRETDCSRVKALSQSFSEALVAGDRQASLVSLSP